MDRRYDAPSARYEREGLSKTTIALRLGCSRATVRKKLQEIERKKTTQENR
jgi:DNA-binding CsgD family transcriptional regulator